MQYVKDIFEAFGGNERIRELTGEKYPTVSAWLQRASIPSKHWPALIEAAKLIGLDLSLETFLAIQRNRAEELAMRAAHSAAESASP